MGICPDRPGRHSSGWFSQEPRGLGFRVILKIRAHFWEAPIGVVDYLWKLPCRFLPIPLLLVAFFFLQVQDKPNNPMLVF